MGEPFLLHGRKASADVNGPTVADPARPAPIPVTGVLFAIGARLNKANTYDTNTLSRPGSVNATTTIAVQLPDGAELRRGDVLEHVEDGSRFRVSSIVGHGLLGLRCFVERLS